MRKILVLAGTTTASLVVGVALLAFSPVSCACLSRLQHLALVAGLDYYTHGGRQYSAKQIEMGLNNRLAGKRPGDYFLECARPTLTTMKCRVNSDESLLLSRGFDVVFEVKQDGTLVRAHVKRSWSLV